VDQSSAGRVSLANLLGQIAIAGLMWTRLVFYAAEMHLFKKLAPAAAAAPVIVESRPL
jgi:hypothetical protein